MSEQLITPAFLFRFRTACLKTDKTWTKSKGLELSAKVHHPKLPVELTGAEPFADLRMAWSDQGLIFNVDVRGKKQAPWCRDSRIQESDGLTVWIDTRDTHNVHRAGRFCHQFVFLPLGEGSKQQNPVAELVNINRAKDNPKQPARDSILVYSETRKNGYKMHGLIPNDALTGWDPGDHPKLGFYYAVMDREVGMANVFAGSRVSLSNGSKPLGDVGTRHLRRKATGR